MCIGIHWDGTSAHGQSSSPICICVGNTNCCDSSTQYCIGYMPHVPDETKPEWRRQAVSTTVKHYIITMVATPDGRFFPADVFDRPRGRFNVRADNKNVRHVTHENVRHVRREHPPAERHEHPPDASEKKSARCSFEEHPPDANKTSARIWLKSATCKSAQ